MTGTHENLLKDFNESMAAQKDRRQKAREADHFVNKSDGQWEPDVIAMYKDQPRYTIDLTSGIVADIVGEMNSMDFDIKVKPAGGPATTEIAQHYDGLIRNIENNSGAGAKYIYRAAGKQMVTSGIGGWGIKQGYRDSMSFDQDLIIYPISNFMDRVWYDPGAEFQDMSDAEFAFKMTSMSMKNYEKDFEKGSKMSVGRDVESQVYSYKKSDAVTVGQYFYKKYEKAEIAMMTNGAVYKMDDDFTKVKDDLARNGITVEGTRETKSVRIYQRMFDGADFLGDAEETVFTYIPIIPVFGNFEISEDKLIYWGVVEKHMDPQRILNYVESRKVSEGALAPRAKKWMTPEQAASHSKTLQTMNINNDPVQLYNHVTNQPPPFETGGAQINPGLSETALSMQGYMQSISGRMDPSRQQGLGMQSGVAIEALQNKGDTANVGYFVSMEIAIAHTCKVIGDAIPRTYDARREVRLDAQDGTTTTLTINTPIVDEATGEVVQLNDLSKGVYSFVCSAGASFSNKQQETIEAINQVATIDPTIMQTGGDIYLANIAAPGMAQIAKRRRAQMIDQGLIPEDELTDEEKQAIQEKQAQAAQQQPEPSAMDQALIATAQAEQEKAQAQSQKVMVDMADTESKIKERDQKIYLAAQAQNHKIENDKADKMLAAMKINDERISGMALTLKAIKEAMGVETIISEATGLAYEEQASTLAETLLTKE
jgi:hypothetical protein